MTMMHYPNQKGQKIKHNFFFSFLENVALLMQTGDEDVLLFPVFSSV